MKHSWIIVPLVFLATGAFQFVVAWNGDRFGLVMLAVNLLILLACYAFYARLAKTSLDGWGRSTLGWGAAQTWAMEVDKILQEAAKEIGESDQEAEFIYEGRRLTASLTYLDVFDQEADA